MAEPTPNAPVPLTDEQRKVFDEIHQAVIAERKAREVKPTLDDFERLGAPDPPRAPAPDTTLHEVETLTTLAERDAEQLARIAQAREAALASIDRKRFSASFIKDEERRINAAHDQEVRVVEAALAEKVLRIQERESQFDVELLRRKAVFSSLPSTDASIRSNKRAEFELASPRAVEVLVLDAIRRNDTAAITLYGDLLGHRKDLPRELSKKLRDRLDEVPAPTAHVEYQARLRRAKLAALTGQDAAARARGQAVSSRALYEAGLLEDEAARGGGRTWTHTPTQPARGEDLIAQGIREERAQATGESGGDE